MNRIMLTGCHSIGKSQTALAISQARPEYLYVGSFAGPVAKRMGFDLNKPHTEQHLIGYQYEVLKAFIESYEATAGMKTIYDRSPIDLAAYLTFGLKRNYTNYKIIQDFTTECWDAMDIYCNTIIYPKANLNGPMEIKDNRPLDYDRVGFDQVIASYVENIDWLLTKRIIVPEKYQYQDRVDYILARI